MMTISPETKPGGPLELWMQANKERETYNRMGWYIDEVIARELKLLLEDYLGRLADHKGPKKEG